MSDRTCEYCLAGEQPLARAHELAHEAAAHLRLRAAAATAATGLPEVDVSFWGSKVADSGTSPGVATFDTTTVDAAASSVMPACAGLTT